MRARSLSLLGAGLAAALWVAACGDTSGTATPAPAGGESSKDATTIFNDAVAAMKMAHDVHLKGPLGTAAIDADVGGGDFNGSFTLQGGRYDVVFIAGAGGDPTAAKVFIRAAGSVWAAAASSPLTGVCLGDRWLQLDAAVASSSSTVAQGASQIATAVAALGDLTRLATALGQSPGALTKGAVSQINGAAAVQVTSASGNAMFVANQGTPYPLRISGATNGLPGAIDFTQWNSGVSFSAPSGAKPLLDVVAGCSTSGGATPTP
jgi:hypothetical protein